MELKEKELNNQAFPGIIHETPGGGIVVSTFDSIINWARSNSLWPLSFATSCCGIEMMSTASAKYDFSRFGFEVARASPRQADVIIIAGTIVNKMAPVLKRLYDQMADPKYVIAYNNRGLAYFTQLKYDLAIADYNKAIELDPKNAFAYNFRGRAYAEQNKYDDDLDLAIADFTKVIEIEPKKGYAYYNRGN
ncbi:MAG: NADH-quinone oxidoreductase subunit NuoB, partial [Sediminibacterium sp.]